MDEGRTFDYEGKYLGKGSVELTPAPVSNDVANVAQSMALTAHEALGCFGYSRTDIIIEDLGEDLGEDRGEDRGEVPGDDRGPVFLELNTLPGLTAASFIPQQLEAAEISMEAFLVRQIELARSRLRQGYGGAPKL